MTLEETELLAHLARAATYLPADADKVSVLVPAGASGAGALPPRYVVLSGRSYRVADQRDRRTDVFIVEWTDPSGYHKAYAHVPRSPSDLASEELYHLARQRGATVEDAADLLSSLPALPLGEREVLTTLLRDGTEWGTALGLAAALR